MTDSSSRGIYRRLAGGVVLFAVFFALAWFLPEYGQWTDTANLDRVYHFGFAIGLALGLFLGPVVASQLQEVSRKHVR